MHTASQTPTPITLSVVYIRWCGGGGGGWATETASELQAT